MTLLGRDARVPKQTLYLDIRLGGSVPARTTAVFFPASFEAAARPDVIVYLAGHGAPPIDRYLADPRFPLRDETNAAGEARTRDLLVVAPTLGEKAEPGDLVDEGLDGFLGEVATSLTAGAWLPHDASSGKVYVAAHSGGGRAARALARRGSRVVEYWLFDALYGPSGWPPTDKTIPGNRRPLGHPDAVEEEWLDVLQGQRVALYCYSLTAEPSLRAKNLEALAMTAASELEGRATFVRSSSPSHDAVPWTHWKERVLGRG